MNTLQVAFNKEDPRPSAVEIHTWIDEKLKVREGDIQTLQLVAKQYAVYIKFKSAILYEQYVQQHSGESNFELMNGSTVRVNIGPAEQDYVTVRVMNVPPEISNDRIKNVLTNYGKIHSIENERWSSRYRFQVETGIRIVKMSMDKHIPVTLLIANYEAYISYHGQEQTCFLCGSTEHLKYNCPSRFVRNITTAPRTRLLMSDLFQEPHASSKNRNTKSSMSTTNVDVNTQESTMQIPAGIEKIDVIDGTDERDKSMPIKTVSDSEVSNVPNSKREDERQQQSQTTSKKPSMVSDSETETDEEGINIGLHAQPGKKLRMDHGVNAPECSSYDRGTTDRNEQNIGIRRTDGDVVLQTDVELNSAVAAEENSVRNESPSERPSNWNDEMADEADDEHTTPTVRAEQGSAKTRSQRNTRLHPYRGEKSKLGFPTITK